MQIKGVANSGSNGLRDKAFYDEGLDFEFVVNVHHFGR